MTAIINLRLDGDDERAAEELELIGDVGRLLRRHHGHLRRQRRLPHEED